MFTGIIEAQGEISDLSKNGTNIRFKIFSPLTDSLQVDQSIAHNGVCLTVVKIEGDFYYVDAIKETLDKTNLKDWSIGSKINLERSLTANKRIDGHFVQGHVDSTARCNKITDENGSWRFYFSINNTVDQVLIEKGSICINGVSLTLVDAELDNFSVAIIPYTFENTNFNSLNSGDHVNIEFDILGKYMQKLAQRQLKSS